MQAGAASSVDVGEQKGQVDCQVDCQAGCLVECPVGCLGSGVACESVRVVEAVPVESTRT